MIREEIPELEVDTEKTEVFDFSDEEIKETIEEIDNKLEESARINTAQEIESIQEAKNMGRFLSSESHNQKKGIHHYPNMEEKKQMVLNGEHIPICVGESNFNSGPVKYYPNTLKKKMKL